MPGHFEVTTWNPHGEEITDFLIEHWESKDEANQRELALSQQNGYAQTWDLKENIDVSCTPPLYPQPEPTAL